MLANDHLQAVRLHRMQSWLEAWYLRTAVASRRAAEAQLRAIFAAFALHLRPAAHLTRLLCHVLWCRAALPVDLVRSILGMLLCDRV